MMEEKQLDLNQPLLSVRRFSSPVSTAESDGKRKSANAFSRVPPLPKYKSELKSGPITNPGTVPFVWERSPGRPKDENKRQTMAPERPPVVPKLPPGRMNVERQALSQRKEGNVAGLSEGRNCLLGSRNVPASDIAVTVKELSSREETEEMDVFGSEDSEETYVDARDTLSRNDSFFLNCSISGVSGLDGPDMKPYGTFSTDQQTRDFMMGRFLPAAKAMASETPQHSTRRPAAQQPPTQIKKIAGAEKRLPYNERSRQSNVPHCSDCNGMKEIREEDNEYDYVGPNNSSPKVCGLFPRLCLQNSFCLLNPIPGMRKQVTMPISSSHITKSKPLYAASHAETVHENDKDAVDKQRSTNRRHPMATRNDKHEQKSESNKTTCQNDYQKSDGLYLYKRLQGNDTSYHNKFSQSAFSEEKGFLGIPDDAKKPAGAKGVMNFGELLANERIEWDSTSASSLVEKTLHVDSVQMVKSRTSNSSSPDSKGLIDCRSEDILKNRGIERIAFFDSPPQDIKNANATSEKVNVLPQSLYSTDSNFLLSSDRSMPDMQMVLMDVSRHDHDIVAVSAKLASKNVDGDEKIDLERQGRQKSTNLESFLIQDSIRMSQDKVADNGKTGSKSQHHRELSNEETSKSCYPLHPLPPPLPISPSESWLMRTLPTFSSKHASLKSFLGNGMHAHPVVQASKVQSPDMKWETIVKTSNVEHGHLRFSEELLAPISEV